MELYIDGELLDDTPTNPGNWKSASTDGSKLFSIGPNTGNNYGANSTFDEVIIFSRKLTGTEIQQIYNKTANTVRQEKNLHFNITNILIFSISEYLFQKKISRTT